MKRYQYTTEDFASKAAARASLLRLVEPLRPLYSEGGARINLTLTSTHYENDSIPMETWARQLWGLVPYWAGGGHRSGQPGILAYLPGLRPEILRNGGNCLWAAVRARHPLGTAQ